MLPAALDADAEGTEEELLELKEMEYEVSVFIVVEDERTVPEMLLIVLLLYECRVLSAALLVKGMVVLSAEARIASGGTELAEEMVFGVDIQQEIGADADVTKDWGEAKIILHAEV